MKAIQQNDKSFTTIRNRNDHSGVAFTYGGGFREHIDPEEARTCFTFNIEKHPCCTEDGREIPNQFHLRRDDNDDIIPTRSIGKEFTPVQHLQVFDYIVNDIMPQVPEMELETVGTLNNGGTGVIMAKFGEGFSVQGDKSGQENRLFFFNPNGSSSLTMGFTNVRLFCQNQMAAAVRTANQSGFRVWHTTNAELKVDHAVESIYEAVGACKHLQVEENRLAEVEVGQRELHALLNKFFPLAHLEEGTRGYTKAVNQRNEVIRQFTEGETAQSIEGDTGWKLFNSFTYPIFNPVTIGKGSDMESIIYSGMVGSRASRVHKIFNAVQEVCNLPQTVFA